MGDGVWRGVSSGGLEEGGYAGSRRECGGGRCVRVETKPEYQGAMLREIGRQSMSHLRGSCQALVESNLVVARSAETWPLGRRRAWNVCVVLELRRVRLWRRLCRTLLALAGWACRRRYGVGAFSILIAARWPGRGTAHGAPSSRPRPSSPIGLHHRRGRKSLLLCVPRFLALPGRRLPSSRALPILVRITAGAPGVLLRCVTSTAGINVGRFWQRKCRRGEAQISPWAR